MDGTGNTGLSPNEWWDVVKWVCGAVAFLLWGYLNKMAGRLDKHDTRLENHAQRLTALDGKTESD